MAQFINPRPIDTRSKIDIGHIGRSLQNLQAKQDRARAALAQATSLPAGVPDQELAEQYQQDIQSQFVDPLMERTGGNLAQNMSEVMKSIQGVQSFAGRRALDKYSQVAEQQSDIQAKLGADAITLQDVNATQLRNPETGEWMDPKDIRSNVINRRQLADLGATSGKAFAKSMEETLEGVNAPGQSLNIPAFLRSRKGFRNPQEARAFLGANPTYVDEIMKGSGLPVQGQISDEMYEQLRGSIEKGFIDNSIGQERLMPNPEYAPRLREQMYNAKLKATAEAEAGDEFILPDKLRSRFISSGQQIVPEELGIENFKGLVKKAQEEGSIFEGVLEDTASQLGPKPDINKALSTMSSFKNLSDDKKKQISREILAAGLDNSFSDVKDVLDKHKLINYTAPTTTVIGGESFLEPPKPIISTKTRMAFGTALKEIENWAVAGENAYAKNVITSVHTPEDAKFEKELIGHTIRNLRSTSDIIGGYEDDEGENKSVEPEKLKKRLSSAIANNEITRANILGGDKSNPMVGLTLKDGTRMTVIPDNMVDFMSGVADISRTPALSEYGRYSTLRSAAKESLPISARALKYRLPGTIKYEDGMYNYMPTGSIDANIKPESYKTEQELINRLNSLDPLSSAYGRALEKEMGTTTTKAARNKAAQHQKRSLIELYNLENYGQETE